MAKKAVAKKTAKPWKPKLSDEEIRNGILAELREVAFEFGRLLDKASDLGIAVNANWVKDPGGSTQPVITCALKL